jgi:probable F420-dependent oxidoreductase
MEDLARILRDIWAGKTVSYSGPAGVFPRLFGSEQPDVEPPPLLLAAIGPKTLALAGRAFDGVILHPFLTTAAVARSREIVRAAAAEAGRDPDSVRVYGELVVAPDMDADAADRIVAARALTYFDMQGLGEALFAVNGWEIETLARIRSHPHMKRVSTFADHDLTIEERIEVVHDTVPADWLRDTSGGGDAADVASRLRAYLDAGIDELVLHGASPSELASVVAAFAPEPSLR